MKPECVDAVNRAAGRTLSKGELDGIEQRLLASMQTLAKKDPTAWHALSRDERFAQASALAKSRMAEDVTHAQAQRIRDATLKMQEVQRVDSVKAGRLGQLAALRQRTIFDPKHRGGQVSLEMQIKAEHNWFMRLLDSAADKGRFFGTVQNSKRQRMLLRAIFGETVADKDVMAAAMTIRETLEAGFQRANNAGVRINRLDNWRLPQPWAWEKFGDREQAVKDILAEIDPTGYVRQDGAPMSRDEIEDVVRAAVETIASDGANKRAPGSARAWRGKGHVGASRNAPRQIHIASADGYIRLMEKYGSANNVYSLLQHHFSGLARDIAAAGRLGRDADTFFPQLVEQAFAADRAAITTEKEAKSLAKLKKQTMKEWEALRTPGHSGDTPLWATISQTIRGVAGATLLGSSTLSAVPDLGMATVYGRHIGLSRRKVLRNVLRGWNPTKENVHNIRRLAVVVNGIQDSAHRFGTGEMGTNTVRFLNHTVHVASLLRLWDRGLAHGISASLMDVLGGQVRAKAYHELPASDLTYLQKHGVTPDLYEAWRQAELDTGPDGKATMLTPDGIYAIPDAKLHPIAERRMAALSENFKAEAAKRAERTAEESSWIAKRVEKFNALRQRARDTLAAMKARASTKEGHAQGVVDARAEQLRATVDRAEVETDIGRYLKTDGTQAQARLFLEAVEEGAAVERGTHAERTRPDNRTDAKIETPDKAPAIGEKMNTLVQRYGREVGAKAEALGRRQGKAEARIAEARKAVADAAKDRAKAMDAKAQQFAKRMDKQATELREFTERMRQRAQKRAEADDAFERQYGRELQREIDTLRADAAQQLLSMALHETQIGARGQAGGSIADQVRLHLTPDKKGTLAGEVFAWLWFLKQTPLGIFRTHMIDAPGGMDSWQSAWMYRAQFLASSAALGALSLALKDIVNGHDPDDLLTMEGVGKILMASGGMGLYGDFVFGDGGDHQNGALAKLLGPGATEIEDAINIFHANASQLTGTADIAGTTRASQGLKFVRNYIAPGMRVWYLKAAFNHLIYQRMMENLSPGYTARVRRRMAKYQRSSWWGPGEALPDRAPELSKAVGE